MQPILELSESRTDPDIIVPSNILYFVKKKLIKLQPKPALNKKKYGDLELDEDIEGEDADLIRRENMAVIQEKKVQAEKEAQNKL